MSTVGSRPDCPKTAENPKCDTSWPNSREVGKEVNGEVWECENNGDGTQRELMRRAEGARKRESIEISLKLNNDSLNIALTGSVVREIGNEKGNRDETGRRRA
jgi:hypothetical protein